MRIGQHIIWLLVLTSLVVGATAAPLGAADDQDMSAGAGDDDIGTAGRAIQQAPDDPNKYLECGDAGTATPLFE